MLSSTARMSVFTDDQSDCFDRHMTHAHLTPEERDAMMVTLESRIDSLVLMKLEREQGTQTIKQQQAYWQDVIKTKGLLKDVTWEEDNDELERKIEQALQGIDTIEKALLIIGILSDKEQEKQRVVLTLIKKIIPRKSIVLNMQAVWPTKELPILYDKVCADTLWVLLEEQAYRSEHMRACEFLKKLEICSWVTKEFIDQMREHVLLVLRANAIEQNFDRLMGIIKNLTQPHFSEIFYDTRVIEALLQNLSHQKAEISLYALYILLQCRLYQRQFFCEILFFHPRSGKSWVIILRRENDIANLRNTNQDLYLRRSITPFQLFSQFLNEIDNETTLSEESQYEWLSEILFTLGVADIVLNQLREGDSCIQRDALSVFSTIVGLNKRSLPEVLFDWRVLIPLLNTDVSTQAAKFILRALYAKNKSSRNSRELKIIDSFFEHAAYILKEIVAASAPKTRWDIVLILQELRKYTNDIRDNIPSKLLTQMNLSSASDEALLVVASECEFSPSLSESDRKSCLRNLSIFTEQADSRSQSFYLQHVAKYSMVFSSFSFQARNRIAKFLIERIDDSMIPIWVAQQNRAFLRGISHSLMLSSHVLIDDKLKNLLTTIALITRSKTEVFMALQDRVPDLSEDLHKLIMGFVFTETYNASLQLACRRTVKR